MALAAALEADVCEIYTDVDGVFTADPRIVPDAQKLDRSRFEEMLELAALRREGAHAALRRIRPPLQRSGARALVVHRPKPGTIISGSMEDIPVEEAILTGVAHDRSEAKVTVVGLPDEPGYAAKVFRAVADAEINIDMVLQNISKIETGKTDITFTLPRSRRPARGGEADQAAGPNIGFAQVLYDDHIGKVSLVGAGMKSHPGVTATFCEALAEAGHQHRPDLHLGDPHLGAVSSDTELDEAVQVLHDAFDLGGDEVAVVHAGTGR